MRRAFIASLAALAALSLAGAAAAYGQPPGHTVRPTFAKLCREQGKLVRCQLSHKLCRNPEGRIIRCPD